MVAGKAVITFSCFRILGTFLLWTCVLITKKITFKIPTKIKCKLRISVERHYNELIGAEGSPF